MATHDYVIANASGSSVRSDINNALAAIVSNNSNPTSPATTYPYQWWADTTTGQLKLRASDNLSWITIFELDGTMLMEDGSASTPGLAFASDLNTGFFRSAADKINFATGGAERLEIGDSEVVFNDPSNDVDFRVESNGQSHMLFVDAGNDYVGIAKSSPSARFHVGGTAGDFKIAADGATIDFTRDGANYIQAAGSSATLNYRSSQHIFTGSSLSDERARIDSSGRLLVGHSSNSMGCNVESGTTGGNNFAAGRFAASTGGPDIVLRKSRNATVGSHTIVQDGDDLGNIFWGGSNGSAFKNAARITAQVDGTPGTGDDMPGRILFYTSADGSISPTERLRIASDGRATFANDVRMDGGTTSLPALLLTANNNAGKGLEIRNAGNSLNVDIGVDGSAYFAGNFGIGTTNPAAKLEVNVGTDQNFTATSTSGLTQIQAINDAGNAFVPLDIAGSYIALSPNSSEAARIDTSGALGIGTASPSSYAETRGIAIRGANRSGHPTYVGQDGSDTTGFINMYADSGNGFRRFLDIGTVGSNAAGTGKESNIRFITNAGSGNAVMRMIIDSSGQITNKSSNVGSVSGEGFTLGPESNGFFVLTRDGDTPLFLNRLTNDGNLVQFYQNSVNEGSISISGTTISYNGGHLTRWSQLAGGAARTEILRGTVLSNLDEMCEWGEEDNEQLNRMQVSDVEGDPNVAGVFQAWDDDDDTYDNDFYCAMTGDFVIRIAQGTTVARGDLLISAGDGTAKPQDDDIVRSKTIAKVTSTTVSTTYSDGSYCVPCVLMAC